MIIVDGRTDKEKLLELLQTGGECNELDFKETLDFSKKLDELDFVKDAVSMFNRYPGGYIIVGANEDGTPSKLSARTDWSAFDGAVLTDKIRKYVAAPLTAISQCHEVAGHTYCLICFLSPEGGLPVPFSSSGKHPMERLSQRLFLEKASSAEGTELRIGPLSIHSGRRFCKGMISPSEILRVNALTLLWIKLFPLWGQGARRPLLCPRCPATL